MIPIPSLLVNVIKKFYSENRHEYFLTGKKKPTEPNVLSALILIKLFFHKIPYRVILKRNGGGNYGKTKDLYH